MKHQTKIALTLALCGLSTQALALDPLVFNIAGLQVTNLRPEIVEVGVWCRGVTHDNRSVGNGSTAFPVNPLADPVLGRGVISGPFQVSVPITRRPYNVECHLDFRTTSNARLLPRTSCDAAARDEAPALCPQSGTSPVVRSGRGY